MDAEKKQAIAELSDREVERMWELALHEEQVLNERSGLFLVANAMMLLFAVEAIDRFSFSVTMLALICGVLMSLFWIVINSRQVDEMRRAACIARMRCESFAIYDELADKAASRTLRRYGASLFAVGVPVLVLLIWIGLVIEMVRRAMIYG